MDYNFWSFIIAVLGIIITVVIAYQQTSKKKLYFIVNKYLNFYDDLLKSFDKLKIEYDGHKIEQNLYFLNGIIYYSGTEDLSDENIVKPISFILPVGGTWKEFKLKNTSENLDVNILKNGSKVELVCPLIKKNEFIYIEGIFESNTQDVDITYRIKNVEKVKAETLQRIKGLKQYSILHLIITIVLLSLYFSVKPFHVKSYDLHPVFLYGNEKLNQYQFEKKYVSGRRIINGENDIYISKNKAKQFEELKYLINKRKVISDSFRKELNHVDPKDSLLIYESSFSIFEKADRFSDSIVRENNIFTMVNFDKRNIAFLTNDVKVNFIYQKSNLYPLLALFFFIFVIYTLYTGIVSLFYFTSRKHLISVVDSLKSQPVESAGI